MNDKPTMEEILIDSATAYLSAALYGNASEMRAAVNAATRKLNDLDWYKSDPEGFMEYYNSCYKD
jgi:hypothetical protein